MQMMVAVASLLVLAACTEPNTVARTSDHPEELAEGLTPGPDGPVLHVGGDRYPLYPPP